MVDNTDVHIHNWVEECNELNLRDESNQVDQNDDWV